LQVCVLNRSGISMNESAAPEKLFDLTHKRVFVAGHRGMVGAAIVRQLAHAGCDVLTVSREQADLRRQDKTEHVFAELRPHVAIVAAAKVGGIYANDTFPAEFIYDNLAIATNVIHSAFLTRVEKLLFLGSSCIYPRLARQPMKEDELLTGPLEPTNQWYAIAKIAGVKLCQAYRSQYGSDFVCMMPTNVFGPGDNYHAENSHVVAALIRRFHEAKLNATQTVTVWGTGRPKREFIYVDDLAEACLIVLERYSGSLPINIGTGRDVTIAELAELVADVVGFHGKLVFDSSRPDGPPRKLLDVSKIQAIGWRAGTSLRVGLERAYADFITKGERPR
jgi:GDP-L-fucose synthase